MQESTAYIGIGKAAKLLNISIDSLRRWDKAGKLTASRTPGGHRVYKITEVVTLMEDKK